jgi:hypothetical protein
MSDINKELIGRLVYIEVEAGVRYWEDATVNGQEDAQGTLIPFRFGDTWAPTIRLSDGQILSWPAGTTADIHYKVCDDGEYWLAAEEGRMVKWTGFYVPTKFLCHGDNGYGDYIILKVSEDGRIQNWRPPAIEITHDAKEQGYWLPAPQAYQGGDA